MKSRRIRWHSPAEVRSSQIFCVSAFGTLRLLPDRDGLPARLCAGILALGFSVGPWELFLEHSNRNLLGEFGGTPTFIDAFCTSPRAVVAIEAKFLFDAEEGFGGCAQVGSGQCAGFHGPGSDLSVRTRGSSPIYCRLETQDGRRTPRRYWQLTREREYFAGAVFRPQRSGETCPFAGPSFQLMRNFLFAAEAAHVAGKEFAVLCMVPQKTSATVGIQLSHFQTRVLHERYRTRVGIATYDDLTDLLEASAASPSRALGSFLRERMNALL